MDHSLSHPSFFLRQSYVPRLVDLHDASRHPADDDQTGRQNMKLKTHKEHKKEKEERQKERILSFHTPNKMHTARPTTTQRFDTSKSQDALRQQLKN